MVSTTKPLQAQKTITVKVMPRTLGGISSAPGIGLREAIAIVLIAGVLAWSMKRL